MAKISYRALSQLASETIIDSALRTDAQILSTKGDLYMKDNRFAYDVAINTWLYMIQESAPSKVRPLCDRIRSKGLRSAVIAASEACDFVIQHIEEIADDPAVLERGIWESPDEALFLSIFWDVAPKTLPDPSEGRGRYVAEYARLMRYLKRMSPLHTDKLSRDAYKDFNQNQNRLKLKDRAGNNRLVEDLVRDEIRDILPWKKWLKRVRDLTTSDIVLTHGVGYDAKADIASKINALWRSAPVCFDLSREWSAFWPLFNCPASEQYNVRMVAVPKTFKKARTIAMEPTYRQALSKRVFQITDELLGRGEIDLHDQSGNQDQAEAGSRYLRYATIDLSHASDDVRDSLITTLFPYEVVQMLALLRPRYYEIDGVPRLLYSWATMGHSLTFVLECLVFDAIARAAVKFAARHGFNQSHQLLNAIRVYGDDIVVPDWAATTVIAFLEALGFVVNEDKTFFGPTYYRESCGAEWYDGYDVSSDYFPRFSLSGDLLRAKWDGYTEEYYSEYTRLVSLQHRLYDRHVDAARYIYLAARDCDTRVQAVPPGIDEDAFWDYNTSLKVKYPPVGRCITYRVLESYRYETYYGILDEGIPADLQEVLKRYTISIPSLKTELQGKLSPLMEQWAYNQFLLHGPLYESEEDRLLGVSTSRLMLFGSPCVTWNYREIGD
jgi:hypothetical protein